MKVVKLGYISLLYHNKKYREACEYDAENYFPLWSKIVSFVLTFNQRMMVVELGLVERIPLKYSDAGSNPATASKNKGEINEKSNKEIKKSRTF